MKTKTVTVTAKELQEANPGLDIMQATGLLKAAKELGNVKDEGSRKTGKRGRPSPLYGIPSTGNLTIKVTVPVIVPVVEVPPVVDEAPADNPADADADADASVDA